MPEFNTGAEKIARVSVSLKPAGIQGYLEIIVGPDENTPYARSGRIGFTATGGMQQVSVPITMPGSEGTFHVYLDEYAEDTLFESYVAEDITIVSPEVYPDIPSPSLQSIAWDEAEIALSYITPYPSFSGKLYLPEPTIAQSYLVRGTLGMDNPSGGYRAASYVGEGLWAFTGNAPIPYNTSGTVWQTGNNECYYDEKYWYMKCPACGRVQAQKERNILGWGYSPETYMKEWLSGHCSSYCYQGHQAHCNVNVAGQVPWSGYEREVYMSPFDCDGTRRQLKLEVYLMEKVTGDVYTTSEVVKQWTLNTGLYCTIQYRTAGKAYLT